MDFFAVVILWIMIILAVVFSIAAIGLWVASKRIEVRIKELNTQLSSLSEKGSGSS